MANRKLTTVIKKCAMRYPDIPEDIVRSIWLDGYSFTSNPTSENTRKVFNKPSKQVLTEMSRLKGFYPFSDNIQENPVFGSEYLAAELQRLVKDSGCDWNQVVSLAKKNSKDLYNRIEVAKPSSFPIVTFKY